MARTSMNEDLRSSLSREAEAELLQSLDLLDDADQMTAEAETFAAAIHELEQRVAAGNITRDDRTDLGGDMLALAETLTAYALRVLA